jgi:diglucosylglycerate octanoyltransferase
VSDHPGDPAFDLDVPRALSHDGPLSLVVVADSTAFTDHLGPQVPTTAHLYPQVAARTLAAALGREVTATVVARPGMTVRDATRTVTKDQHVQYDVLAHADAVVLGVGSFDHAPLGVPPSVEAVAAYLRPTGLRRRVRGTLKAAYPWLVRATGGRRTRTPWDEFERLFVELAEHVRGLTWGRVAGAAVGPTSHRSRYYGPGHPTHARSQSRHLDLAERHGFRGVAAWPLVEPYADELNVDGIHWPVAAHEAVGRAVAAALLPALRGEAPTVGLPSAAAAALGRDR